MGAEKFGLAEREELLQRHEDGHHQDEPHTGTESLQDDGGKHGIIGQKI